MDISKEQFENAIKQMQDMNKKSSMPPVPPFVKISNDNGTDSASNGHFADKNANKPKLFSKDLFKFLDMKNFEMDSDRILLLVMISMLSGESHDEILLFALLYIML